MFSGLAVLGASAVAWLSSARFWIYLLAIVAIFGAGWYFGSAHIAGVYAEAAIEEAKLVAKAKKAEYERGVKDTAERLAKNTKAGEAAVRIKRVVVRVPGTCDISADSMKKLNDPELIGQ